MFLVNRQAIWWTGLARLRRRSSLIVKVGKRKMSPLTLAVCPLDTKVNDVIIHLLYPHSQILFRAARMPTTLAMPAMLLLSQDTGEI